MKRAELKDIDREPAEELEAGYTQLEYLSIRAQTNSAVLFVVRDQKRSWEEWYPKSQLRKDQSDLIWVSNWITEQRRKNRG